ncbi:DUF2249 domain-containing protein [Rathayibacter sp. CAU 1779]
MNDPSAAARSIRLADSSAVLIDMLEPRTDAVATRRVLKAPGFRLVRITLDAGQTMREHEAAVPILIQVISGSVDIDVDGVTERFEAGGILYIAPHVRHALHAEQRSDVLLTLADASARVPHDGAGVGETSVAHQDPAGESPAEAGGDRGEAAADPDPHGPDPEHRARLEAAVCECGVAQEEAFPEFDVRGVPHAIRHATVFGALDSLAERGGLVLVAPHDPVPLLGQIRERTGDGFTVTYLERGPEAWRLQFVRTGVRQAA